MSEVSVIDKDVSVPVEVNEEAKPDKAKSVERRWLMKKTRALATVKENVAGQLRTVREKLAGFSRRDKRNSETEEEQILEQNAQASDAEKTEEMDGKQEQSDVEIATKETLRAISLIIEQPVLHKLSKTEGQTRTTRFLKRPERDWRDGIQVDLYNQGANTKASIMNYTTEEDDKGKIVGRKSLVIDANGNARVIHAVKNGYWESQTLPATDQDIDEACDKMNALYVEEERKNDWTSRNIELFKNHGEAGKAVLPYYLKALELHPELRQVAIIPEEKGKPFHRTSGNNLVHTVNIPLEAIAITDMQKALADNPTTEEYFAELLGIDREEFHYNPNLANIFAILHELGHADDYLRYSTAEEVEENITNQWRTERQALPVPNTTPRRFREPYVQEWIDKNWQYLSSKYGITSKEELSVLQQQRYRSMRTEHVADLFAQGVIKAYNTQEIN